jgi:23S rRNA maturation-related 3'-5' exoribonuclease YhaM
MINDTKEPTKDHKNTQKEILQEITEIFMEEILDMVNQNLQVALRKFQEKTQKQISELRGALNKHHSETEVTIKREISELKKKIKY